ncbi:MAG: molybdopterin-dependent oxidoreductase [Gammaproteobacteria bacterium]|nr:molybdopterin-dependent oxidoreductase [Gammaproteobacteria bacterium]
MSGTIDRRNFLKIMGWGGVGTALSGCDLPSTVTLEEGKEEVMSYLMPEEYVIPGVGVWYASVCAQCSAACGTHGRVREGRVLKLEGNPESPINNGNLCMMGQAGVQGHYNPDRIKSPMMREGGKLMPVSWEKAMSTIKEKIAAARGDQVAWFTGALSGHQFALVANYLEALGSKNHYAHETINNSVWQSVCKDTLGEANPRLRLDKAQMVVSFGADFLGTWVSPVHFSGEYVKFRKQARRGLLVQIEPKMSLTGANADLWLPSLPGTEGVIALGIANSLVKNHNKDISQFPSGIQDLINKYDAAAVTKMTGVDEKQLKRIAELLNERSPSLVLAGAPVEGHANGYNAVAAVMLLNQLLGNIGNTIESAGVFPFEQMQGTVAGTSSLFSFTQAAKNNKLAVAFFHGANPKYTAPTALDFDKALNNVPFKVALAQFLDETTMAADVVLPLASYLEDWGTHVAAYQPEQSVIGLQQPLMEKLYADTRGLGDILMDLLKTVNANEYGGFADYYAYLRQAHAAMPMQNSNNGTDQQAWNASLQKGVIKVTSNAEQLTFNAVSFDDPVVASSDAGTSTLYLAPSARLGLWDGRHANLPWLQEAPDQISKLVWDSWAEIHPSTAAKLGIKQGSIVSVKSEHGAVNVKAVLLKSIHPDVIAIPMGQGHEFYGRYAEGRGANPLKILNPTKEEKTGELAMYATRVSVSKTNQSEVVVKMGSSDTQVGRRLVVTMPVEQYQRSEGA